MKMLRIAPTAFVLLLMSCVATASALVFVETQSNGSLTQVAQLQDDAPDAAAPAPEVADESVPEVLDNPYQKHIVRLTPDGAVEGRVALINPDTGMLVDATDISVRLVSDGVDVGQASLDAIGRFRIDNVEPGVYGLIASGDGGFLTYTVIVAPARLDAALEDGTTPVAFQEVADALRIESAAVPPRDFGVLRQLLQRYLPDEPEGESSGGVALPPLVNRPGDDLGLSTPRNYRPITLRQNGTIVGRLLPAPGGQPARNGNAFLIRDNELIAQVPVDNDGLFEVGGLEPGVHSLVCATPGGFTAFSINLVNQEVAQTTVDGLTPVNLLLQGGADVEAIQTDASNLNQNDEDPTPPNAPVEPAAPAAAAGGGGTAGGGGGVGGGGGGLLDYLLPAAAAAGIAAAIDDDDNPPATAVNP